MDGTTDLLVASHMNLKMRANQHSDSMVGTDNWKLSTQDPKILTPK